MSPQMDRRAFRDLSYGFYIVISTDGVDLGTHTIFIGDVVSSEVLKSGRPLTYQYYHEELKGKSPPSAPTFESPAQEHPKA